MVMKFKIGDKVRILSKSVGNFSLREVRLKIGDIVTIKRTQFNSNHELLYYMVKEGLSDPIFKSKDLKLLDKQEQLNRKYRRYHEKISKCKKNKKTLFYP
jgi:hypothetical protein